MRAQPPDRGGRRGPLPETLARILEWHLRLHHRHLQEHHLQGSVTKDRPTCALLISSPTARVFRAPSAWVRPCFWRLPWAALSRSTGRPRTEPIPSASFARTFLATHLTPCGLWIPTGVTPGRAPTVPTGSA